MQPITRLVVNMRVFVTIVKIFRMPTTMFSSVQFSVFISCLMSFSFCSIIFCATANIGAKLRDAGNRQSSLPQLAFLLMDDNALS